MKFSVALASCLAVASAAPAALSWSPELGLWYKSVSEHIREAKTDKTFDVPSCTLKDVEMDQAPTPLPSPTGSPVAVILGRGVQNYTCDLSNTTAVPKAVGAIANLYDVSCIASNKRYKDMLDQIPALALQYQTPKDSEPFQPANIQRMGHHYFDAAGVPTFDLDDSIKKTGVAKMKVANKSPAPDNSVKGQNNQGYGSVPWLLLNRADGGAPNMGQIYRLHTAGGQPSSSCQGQQAAFSVEYASLYYVWS